jgi:hypothetical protein
MIRDRAAPLAALLLTAAIAASAWLVWHVRAAPAVTPTPTQGVTVQVILDYGVMSDEQIIDNSDAIFVGQVLAVSGTSANQDSGRDWTGGLPVYTTDVQILQSIVDTLALPERVRLTSVGYSPLEGVGAGFPKVGQRAVFFVIQTRIAWRDGSKQVLRTTNTDSDSIRLIGDSQGAAGTADEAARLNVIVQAIANRRSILAQPGRATPTVTGR